MTESNIHHEPKVLWGEHRTSEPLAMSIKTKLQADLEISKKVPFLEYEKYKITDYTELLHKRREMESNGLTDNEQGQTVKDLAAEEKQYELQLKEQHGPLVFNFHDGYQRHGVNFDIEFRIPKEVYNKSILTQYLKDLAEQHGLRIQVKTYEGSFIIPPPSVIVEFMTPNADEISSFPSQEIELMARKYDPLDEGARDFIDYKIADTSKPEFIEASDRYTAYMKDVLLGLSDVRIA